MSARVSAACRAVVAPSSRTRIVPAALVVAALGALAGCGGSESGSKTDVTVRLPFAAGTLDPQRWSDGSAQVLASYAYDSPVAYRKGEVVPLLASKWEVTPKSAKLWIKPDITCSDGSKLTAAEVADSIARMKDPKKPAPNAITVFGSPTGFSAKANPADNSVTVKLDKPHGDLLYGLTQVNVVCRAGLEDPAQLTKKTIGSGPYVLDDVVSGDRYTYRARDGYTWGPGGAEGDSGRPEKLVFKVLESETTATNGFLTGGLDLTMAQGPDRARLAGNPRTTATKPVVSGAYTMYLNHRQGRPTADANVRRLLFAGADRAGLARTMLGKDAEVPRTVLNPDAQCYDPEAVGSAMVESGVDAARGHATAAGYELAGDKLTRQGKQLTVKVLIPDLFGPKIADYLISSWGAVGVKVDASVKPAEQVVKTVSTPGSDWDVVLTGIDGDTPTRLLGAFATPPPPDGPNFSGVRNEDFLKVADQAKAKLTADACELWTAAERELYEQADFIPWVVFEAGWYGHEVTFEPWTLQGVYPETVGVE